MKTYLKWTIIGCIFAIPFLSFYVADTMFFPYIAGKNFGFRILVEIMFGAWIVLAYLDAEYRPKMSYITAAILALVVVVGIADTFGVDPQKSFWSNYERMEGYVTIVHLFAYFLVASSVMNSQKMWYWLFHIMIVASVVLGFMGLSEVFSAEGTGRLSTTLGNSIYLAVYMLFHMFITAYYLFKDDVKDWLVKHYLYIGAIIVQFLNLYYTATRGTLLGLIGGIFLMALIIAAFEKKNKGLRKIAFGLVGGVVLVVALFFTLRDTPFVTQSQVLNRFNTITLSTAPGKIDNRFIIWGMALEGFQEKPVLGWGQDNFPYVFNKYYDPRLFGAEPWFDRAHNVFFDWLIAAGALGLLAYLSIFAAVTYLLWKKKETDFSFLTKAIFTGLLSAYFFHNIFVFDNLISYILFFTFLSFIHASSVQGHQGFMEPAKNFFSNLFGKDTKRNEDITVLGGVMALTVAVMYFVNYGAYEQNKVLIQALRVPAENVETSLSLYKKALAYDTFGNSETRERLVFQAQQVYAGNASQVVKDEYYTIADREIQKQIKSMPGESKYLLFASSLYSAKKDYASAIEALEKARSYSPQKDIILFSLGDTYANVGDYAKALAVYKEAYDNAPRNTKAAVRYAYAAIQLDNEKLASDILTPIYGTYLIPDPLIVNIYASRNRFDIVRDIFINGIEQDSKNPQYRFQLAGTYLQLKEKDKAVETLEQAMADLPVAEFPEVHKDAKMYIEQINAGTLQ